eukprot:COSAG01_NODE_53994_length_335_cov_0.860169_2_plen_30_part_01
MWLMAARRVHDDAERCSGVCIRSRIHNIIR